MAWFKVEASSRHHFKFNRLAETLRIRRAEARGLFLGLCAWASETAPDGRLDGYTHRDIEMASDWQGKSGRLVTALVAVGLLDEIEGGSLEIHDFFERAESYKHAQKMRARRHSAVTVPSQLPHCAEDRTGEDRQDKRESARGALAEKASHEFDSRGQLPPVGKNHPEVAFFEAEYHKRFGGPPFSPLERSRAAEVIRRCAEASTPWPDVLDFYARGFDFSGHTVDWLRDHLREVLNKLGVRPNTDDPEPKPTSPEWAAWFQRQQERGR
jgi:hypothetical protein